MGGPNGPQQGCVFQVICGAVKWCRAAGLTQLIITGGAFTRPTTER